MAFITPTSGTTQPVFATDVSNGSIAGSTATAATPVNLQGPSIDFIRAVANTSVAGQQGTNGYVGNVIQGIQRVATVAFYQVDATVLSFGTFPVGAFGNVTSGNEWEEAVFLSYANVTTAGFSLSSATNIGFKLAAS
jgi:hypothetical protein